MKIASLTGRPFQAQTRATKFINSSALGRCVSTAVNAAFPVVLLIGWARNKHPLSLNPMTWDSKTLIVKEVKP